MNLHPYYTCYMKVNPKQIKHIHVRLATIEHLEETTGENFYSIKFGNDILDRIPKEQAIKAKTDKWDYFKQMFLHSK